LFLERCQKLAIVDVETERLGCGIKVCTVNEECDLLAGIEHCEYPCVKKVCVKSCAPAKSWRNTFYYQPCNGNKSGESDTASPGLGANGLVPPGFA
jgi:hypothetical protein